ncbi:MAG: hypothetical protein FWH07_00805 [Oscillospiraceae bacterium]|nr:hypothetical protein [Oscillospiraceae bacterium]
MKKILTLMLLTAFVLSVCPFVSFADTKNDQILWILNSAQGNGEFSYKFELARTQAQIDAEQRGQTGIVEGKDGHIRVFHENRTDGVPNGTYTETTNSNAMAVFARNYRLLTIDTAQSWFIFEGDTMCGVTTTDFNGNTVTKQISELKNSLSGLTANAPHSNKTQLWWLIDAARGKGEFSYEFELAPSQAQIDAGTHGQRGVVEGKDGNIRVYHLNSNGTYTETTNSNAMAIFARNYRFLTQRNHNHNNAGQPGRIEPSFPAWLGFDNNGEEFGNSNFELFPLVSHATLTGAANPYEMNLLSADTEREKAMLFIYEGGTMSAVRYYMPNGDAVLKKITNLKPALSGIEGIANANHSNKTQLWWIIDSARGKGEFSFSFELEDGTKGSVQGKDGTVSTYTDDGNGTYSVAPGSVVATTFASRFKLLTQFSHNHNNETTAGEPGSRPFPAPHPEWLGLTDNGVGFANGNYELFPLVAEATLTGAANPFEMNLTPERATSGEIERTGDMFFVYDNGVMSAACFNNTYIKISNLKNSVESAIQPDFILGRILDNNDEPTIFDVLEILKHIVGMNGVIKSGGPDSRAWNAALITPESQVSGTPTIFDVLEILKYIVGMDSLVG